MPTQVPNSGYSATPFEEPIALKPFLKGIADAIREKKKTTELINAQNFRSEILSIQGGVNVVNQGGGVIKTLEGDYEAVDIVVTENKTVDVETYLDNKQMPLSVTVNVESTNIVSQGGVVVPNNTYVEKIYFNTSLSVEEVVALLSQLTYTSEGMNALALKNATQPIGLAAGFMNGVYIIADLMTMTPYFASAISTDLPQEVFNFVGWSPDFSGVIEVNGDLIDYDSGMSAGTENDKLIDLMSITNSFGVGGEIIKTLGGDYEAVNIEVTENTIIDISTMLDNKQIPINVKVNVGQFVEVTGDSGTLTTAQMSLLASNETYVLKDGVKYYYTHSETIDSTEIKHYRAILKYDTTTSPDTITLGEFGYIPSTGMWQSGESTWT